MKNKFMIDRRSAEGKNVVFNFLFRVTICANRNHFDLMLGMCKDFSV